MAWTKVPGYRKDGRTKLPEYSVWYAMKQRCRYVKCERYPSYGGRGIDYCDEWGFFDVFIHDMGSRPTDKHQLDRIDNNKGYYKENCRWVTRGSNQANKRRPSDCMGAYMKPNGRYKSMIGIEGVLYTIGTYATKEEAQAQYIIMFKEWYGFEPNKEKVA